MGIFFFPLGVFRCGTTVEEIILKQIDTNPHKHVVDAVLSGKSLEVQ
jgi:hypothetical protein